MVCSYGDIIDLDNLLQAWREFIHGKRSRKDVQEFERDLMTNIISLHHDLANKTYRHSAYEAFNISDPKPRSIHKASVRDRLLHHALYRKLYTFFDETFIADSYSCRLGKGTHRALNRFRSFAYKVSRNQNISVWVLKSDIKKFFASIDQGVLINILKEYISDNDIIWLLSEIIGSFYSTKPSVGLPLGNLTSQLLVNIYMNRFDQFMKHKIKARYYIRYADDFVVLSHDKTWLETIRTKMSDFLFSDLRLQLHPDKTFIQSIYAGVDFLGWVNFIDHRSMRTVTKRRILKNVLAHSDKEAMIQSYLGLCKHGNAKKLSDIFADQGLH